MLFCHESTLNVTVSYCSEGRVGSTYTFLSSYPRFVYFYTVDRLGFPCYQAKVTPKNIIENTVSYIAKFQMPRIADLHKCL